jgi:hypothetical protein
VAGADPRERKLTRLRTEPLTGSRRLQRRIGIRLQRVRSEPRAYGSVAADLLRDLHVRPVTLAGKHNDFRNVIQALGIPTF